jgi:hypothetical protein
MEIRYFSLCALLLLSFTAVRSVDQEQVGLVQKCTQVAKKLTKRIPSMQEIKATVSKAKDAVITKIKANPRIAIVIGAGATLLTSAYLYCRHGSRKVNTTATQPVATKSVAVENPTGTEYVETVNDSDVPLTLRVIVPARSRARTQIVKS